MKFIMKSSFIRLSLSLLFIVSSTLLVETSVFSKPKEDSKKVSPEDSIKDPMEKRIYILLNDENVVKRRHAAITLWHYPHPRSVNALIEALEDDDSQVRKNAVRSLGKLRSKKAIPDLIELLDEEEGDLRNQAVRSLGLIGGKEVVGPLIAALDDEDKVVRMSAIWSLKLIRDKRALRGLIERLFEEDKEVRAYAAQALGDFGDKRAVKYLKHAYMNDKDLSVRQNAALSLRKLGVKVDFPTENG
ncbi:MAG TPA: HEAT repeat domain-containing protein [Spirochaetes bacterium]|nr:HEAT repeat domain-containing protein [Spirochaetota bacterium]